MPRCNAPDRTPGWPMGGGEALPRCLEVVHETWFTVGIRSTAFALQQKNFAPDLKIIAGELFELY